MNLERADQPISEYSPKPNLRSLRLIFPAAWALGVAILVWQGADLSDTRDWLGSLGPEAPILFILISIALMSVVVPKTAVSVTAGVLFGTTLGTSLMVVIAVTAASLNYSIGRWWLHDSIHRKLRQKQLASDDSQSTWMHGVAELAGDAGFSLHLLIRLSPIPTMIISYSMGALGCRFAPYLLAAAAAIIPQILWVHSGATATMVHSTDASALRWISLAMSIAVAVLVSIIVPREAIKRLNESRAAHEDEIGNATT